MFLDVGGVKLTILLSDLTLAGSEFHRAGATKETIRVPDFVFTEECNDRYF